MINSGKKIVLSLLLLSLSLQADFVRVETGVGMWNANLSGDAKYKSANTFDIEDDYGITESSTDMYFWGFIKHPVPLVPNLRVEHTKFEATGNADVPIQFKNLQGIDDKTSLNLDQSDVALYYNLLDETFWVTVDAGLNFKIFNGSLKVGNDSESINVTIPMAYLRGRANIPATDIAVEADSKYISYDGSTLQDLRVKVDYALFTSPALDFAVECGYRTQSYTIDTSGIDIDADFKISGIFLGAAAKF